VKKETREKGNPRKRKPPKQSTHSRKGVLTMAITAAQLQTALGGNATVLRHCAENQTWQEQYVIGNPGTAYAGKARWVQTTAANSAATQAAAILAAL
jgi:hypothetical protein